MSKIYLAGPITGIKDYPARFAEAETRWRDRGWDVVNPAALDDPERDGDMDWHDYMRRDIPLLVECQAIAMLPGWQDSKGARLEEEIARALGMLRFDSDKMARMSAPEEDRDETVLEEAARVVDGPRMEDYGSPTINHTRTAALWSIYTGADITPEQVCVMNILQKISRAMNRTTRDTLVDICGYARNIEIVREETA